MTSDKFNDLRNELYAMLRDEIRKAVEGEEGRSQAGSEAGGSR